MAITGKSVINVRGIERLSASQLRALDAAAAKLGIPVDWLATVISFETAGTFSPTIRNQAGSGAFGLIQFMPSTAKGLLGTSTNDEAVRIGLSMSFEEQLTRMVIPYLARNAGRYKKLSDVYLAIFYPVAMGKPADYVIGAEPGAVYTLNKGFDKTGKGYITRADVTASIDNLAANSARNPRIAINTPMPWGQVTAGATIAVGALWAGVHFLPKKYVPSEYRALDPIKGGKFKWPF